MCHRYRTTFVSLLGALVLSGAASAASAQAKSAPKASPAKARPATEKLTWTAGPPNLPRGARMAVVSGDPSKSGPFEVRLSMPNGYKIPPHFHPTDETVTVKSGSFLYGMGDKLDRAQMKTMKPGQSGTMPANSHHYAMARGKTQVSVSGEGPFVTTYVNPADDPSKKTAKK